VQGINFFVGIGSLSALIVSAINGGKIIYIDYEKIYQSNMVNKIGISNLPDMQCVFYTHAELKSEVQKSYKEKHSNPKIGDLSQEIANYDPFTDKNASQRIASFVEHYLHELDEGKSVEDAMNNSATEYKKNNPQGRITI